MGAVYGSVRALSPARAVLTDAAGALPAVDLVDVARDAALQTRVDHTYLVPVTAVATLFGQLRSGLRLRALEIGGRRAFGYESVYFDTPDLLAYRQHVQRYRRRFKVRTRTYLDSGDCMLEVKTLGGRSETIKHRIEYDVFARYRLDARARAFVAEHTRRPDAIDLLRPTLVTSYHRFTLVDLLAGVRLTCDVDLTCRAGAGSMAGLDELVLIETKTARGTAAISHAFHRAGARSIAMSKYCVGVAALYDGVTTNPWHRVMRRYFGSEPT
jgi:hypothetical protein